MCNNRRLVSGIMSIEQLTLQMVNIMLELHADHWATETRPAALTLGVCPPAAGCQDGARRGCLQVTGTSSRPSQTCTGHGKCTQRQGSDLNMCSDTLRKNKQ